MRDEGQLKGTGGKTVEVPADTACLLLLSATMEGSLQNAVTSTRWQVQLKDVLLTSYFPVCLIRVMMKKKRAKAKGNRKIQEC